MSKKWLIWGAVALVAWQFLGKKKSSSPAAPAALPPPKPATVKDQATAALTDILHRGLDFGIGLAKEKAGGGTSGLNGVLGSVGAYGDLGGTFYNAGAY